MLRRTPQRAAMVGAAWMRRSFGGGGSRLQVDCRRGQGIVFVRSALSSFPTRAFGYERR
jgi:hypothetical protein